jgi:hypothetical protein
MSVPLTALEYTDRVLKRAQYEAFEFTVDDQTVHVRNGSHANPAEHEYEVHVENGIPQRCTCPADEQYEGACKHRVGVAIRTPLIQACAQQRVAADGGRPGKKDPNQNESSSQCTSLGGFPCWECVRTGRRDITDQ